MPTTQVASANDYTYGRNANYTPRNGDLRPRDTNTFRETSNTNDDFTYMQDGPSDVFYEGGSGNNDSQTRFSRPQFDKFAKRTVLISNLPEGVTHADIVDNVRGGMLLDIFLRTHDRAASVSFLEEAHAQEFFRHVKRHDLYIRGKRARFPLQSLIFVQSLTSFRSRFDGTTANSSCHLMLQIRYPLVQRETWLSEIAVQSTLRKPSVTTWSTFTIWL